MPNPFVADHCRSTRGSLESERPFGPDYCLSIARPGRPQHMVRLDLFGFPPALLLLVPSNCCYSARLSHAAAGRAVMIGIYGVNGFIGRHVLHRLAAGPVPVRAISRHIGQDLIDRYSNVEFLEADLHDTIAMGSSLQDIDTVIQLISTSSPGLQNDFNVSDIRDNVIPHVEFIQSSVKAGVRKFIFLSSGGTVYGPTTALPIKEDAPTNPISSHGLTKLTIEKYLQMHGQVDGLNFVVLRLSNPFGPGQLFRKGQGLIPAVMSRYAHGQPIQIIGNGTARRDYIFIEDVIDAIEAAITRNDVNRAIINIGSGKPRSVMEVIETIESVRGIRFQRNYVKDRKTDVDVNYLDISRAFSLIGWAPKTDFHLALEKTLPNYATLSAGR